jgi:hypothetical protein
VRAPRRAAPGRQPTIPRNGGFTFAECPDLAAPEARILWRADVDPGTLTVIATPTVGRDPDGVDPNALSRWLTIVADPGGVEHAVLSDGWHHIRLDLEAGTLTGDSPIVLSYRLRGIASAVTKILPLRRLLHLCRHHRFAASLFPNDRRIERWIELLRVHDALADGATQREIAQALFGAERVASEWSGPSDSLRSRTRRLIRDATVMAQGGYRSLLRGAPPDPADES